MRRPVQVVVSTAARCLPSRLLDELGKARHDLFTPLPDMAELEAEAGRAGRRVQSLGEAVEAERRVDRARV